MSKPKILLIDIETAPDLVWTWEVYNSNAISVQKHWQMLSFSAEWISGDVKPKIVTKGLPDYSGYFAGSDDRDLATDIWNLLNQADVVVAHNGLDFDMRKINARLITLGFVPPKPYKVIDTRKEIARVAGFSSNKLDWLAKQLDLGHKMVHEGWSRWQGCIDGDLKSWRKMLKYNRHDIVLLKKLYEEIQPWIRVPNLAAWNEDVSCPHCGSKELIKQGFKRNKTRVYQQWSCKRCGSWCRNTAAEKGRGAKVVAVDVNERA